MGCGKRLQRVIVFHDQDPVFTGYGWTALLLLNDHVRVSYALNAARDIPEMEGFNNRFKTENRSLFLDAQTLDELEAVVAERMAYYNRERRHSSIGYRAPASYLATLRPWRLHHKSEGQRLGKAWGASLWRRKACHWSRETPRRREGVCRPRPRVQLRLTAEVRRRAQSRPGPAAS